jgi:hypothetical protein
MQSVISNSKSLKLISNLTENDPKESETYRKGTQRRTEKGLDMELHNVFKTI